MEPLKRPSLAEAKARLNAAQKPGYRVPGYMRWVNRGVARRVAAPAAALGLRPDLVTWMSALLSAAGMAVLVLAPASWGTGILISVLFALGFVLDSADGQVARLSGASSLRGEWLDHVVDSVRTPAMHVCVAVALWHQHRVSTSWLLVPLAFALVATGTFMVQILAEQLLRQSSLAGSRPGNLTTQTPSGSAGNGWLKSVVLLPVDFGILCWSFLCWGDIRIFTAVYTALAVVNAGYLLIAAGRKAAALSAAQVPKETAVAPGVGHEGLSGAAS